MTLARINRHWRPQACRAETCPPPCQLPRGLQGREVAGLGVELLLWKGASEALGGLPAALTPLTRRAGLSLGEKCLLKGLRNVPCGS